MVRSGGRAIDRIELRFRGEPSSIGIRLGCELRGYEAQAELAGIQVDSDVEGARRIPGHDFEVLDRAGAKRNLQVQVDDAVRI